MATETKEINYVASGVYDLGNGKWRLMLTPFRPPAGIGLNSVTVDITAPETFRVQEVAFLMRVLVTPDDPE